MTLTAPAFLIALGLLAPVLIAFLVRRRRRVVRVPSTIVWRLGARAVARSRRIRDLHRLLALAACLAAVTALAIAAARPAAKQGEALVFVVDVSASMDGEPIAEARRFLARRVTGLGQSGSVAIVTAGREARIALAPAAPGPRVDEAIAALRAERATAAIDEALAIADGLATRVVVVSDAPIDAAASRRAQKPEGRVVGRRSADNLGITALSTRVPEGAAEEAEREAEIAIATSSPRSRSARLVVTLAGRVVADRRIALEARGEEVVHVALHGAGALVARVTPDDGAADAIALDDEARLEEAVRRPPRVALVAAQDGPAGFFVAQALRAAGASDVRVVAPGAAVPADAEVAVLVDDAPRPAIPTFLIGPGAAAMNVVPATEGTHLRSILAEDPLLRGVALDDLTLARARVAKSLPAGARTLVDLDAGPALVTGGTGARAWVWLGIDPEGSDLVLRVAFPVLVGNVLAHLSGASQVAVAEAAPAPEVTLAADPPPAATLPPAYEPRWPVALRPASLLALLAVGLLAFEAWLSLVRRRAPVDT